MYVHQHVCEHIHRHMYRHACVSLCMNTRILHAQALVELKTNMYISYAEQSCSLTSIDADAVCQNTPVGSVVYYALEIQHLRQ